jgi:hypothetical protein
LKNVEVRVTDVLPTTTTEMFTGGQLLGSFPGPGTDGQVIPITASVRPLRGQYVLVQQTHGTVKEFMNLHEVIAWATFLPVSTAPAPVEGKTVQ